MKIASFTMMRNEAAIIGPFLDQLEEFFDYSAIVDHSSIDHSVPIIKARENPKIELLHLTSRGYPQGRLATFMMKQIFEQTSADWLCFLDCDEFLPFENRSEFETKLAESNATGYCHLQWANIAPVDMSGDDIFTGKFLYSGSLSPYRKIMVSRSLFEAHADLKVLQGYHGCESEKHLPESKELSERGLYHIPVSSRLRFAAKVKSSSQQLLQDKMLVAKGMGFHWINHYRDLSTQGFENFNFHKLALNYPVMGSDDQGDAQELQFEFPYVCSAYDEKKIDLMLLLYPETQSGGSTSYLLCDDKGRIISSSSPSISDHHESFHAEKDESVLDQLSFGQEFADLIEPLFSLPMKLPMTAWAGHIPFLMTLIKLMRPRTFVELGTHFGASLIGAATASKSFNVPMKLYAIDSWEGDEHAGFYNGDDIFRELRNYTNARFNNVELIRSYFDDANARFAPGSIDILHIDGLHTYEAVKHDFLSWLPKMAPDGVILFHDVCVHERGFGVYQLWEELQEKFDTMTFSHSFGLGVCLLDSQSPRIGSIGRLARNKKTAQFYSALVAQIGGLLHSRMHYLDLQENGRESERDAYRQIANLKERVSTLESAVQKLEDRKDVQCAIIRDMKSELLFYQQQSRIGFGDK